MLPEEVEDSLGLVAGGALVAEQGSAGWPVSCAETEAGSAGMQVGSLLHTYSINAAFITTNKSGTFSFINTNNVHFYLKRDIKAFPSIVMSLCTI